MRYASRDKPTGDAAKLDGYQATEFVLVSDAATRSNDLLLETGDSLLTENSNYIIL